MITGYPAPDISDQGVVMYKGSRFRRLLLSPPQVPVWVWLVLGASIGLAVGLGVGDPLTGGAIASERVEPITVPEDLGSIVNIIGPIGEPGECHRATRYTLPTSTALLITDIQMERGKLAVLMTNMRGEVINFGPGVPSRLGTPLVINPGETLCPRFVDIENNDTPIFISGQLVAVP